MKRMKILASLLVTMLSLSVLTACGGSNPSQGGNGEEGPDKLVFAFLPNEEDADDNRKKGRDILMKDLSDHMGIPVEVVIADDYNATIETMRNGNAHIANFGPFSYIIAHDRSNAQAVAVTAKDKDSAYYQSYIVTLADSGIEDIEDIRDKNMTFVDPASTSGNLIPRATISKALDVPANEIDGIFSNTQFSGSHQNSLTALVNNAVDVAACSSVQYQKSLDAGLFEEGDLRILIESDPIPTSPYAISGDLPQEMQDKLREFFLTYDNEEYFNLSGDEGKHFEEIQDSDYDYIRDIAESMNMSPEELLAA